jgi:Beta propeller domain
MRAIDIPRTGQPAEPAGSARPTRSALCLLAALWLAGCGGGSGGAAPPPPPVADAPLVRAQPGELTAYLRDRVRLRQGLGSPVPSAAAGSPPADLAAQADAAVANTWLQEPGVDEDDLIKAAGSEVFSLHENTLRHDRLGGPGSLTRQQALALAPEPGEAQTRFHGLYLADDGSRLTVLGQSWEVGQWAGDCGAEVCPMLGLIAIEPTVQRVLVQPVAVAGTLSAGERVVIDGRWVGSRRLGDRLVVVTTHVPALAVDALPAGTPAAEREAAIAALEASDLLPQVRVGSAPPRPLVEETDCLLQTGNASPDVEITTVTVFDLASPSLARRSLCFVGGTEAIYMSPDALVLATTRWVYADAGPATVYPPQIRTDIHRFALDGTAPVYRASGSVDGHLGWDPERKSHRFSQWNGQLRVLSYTGETGWASPADAGHRAPSPATLTVLQEDAGQLRELARLPNAARPEPLGKPGEQVYAVRFAADRGYLVTFRQVDPLYVLDLANAADPRTVGVLGVPGFSQDLFPTGEGWLLGVGREADADGAVIGLKLALFDVRDPARPRLQASQVLGGPGSSTALDHSRHGLNLRWQDGVARVALPVALAADGSWRHGLQRLEVDPAAGTLQLKPLIDRTPPLPGPDLSADRSLQIGEQLVWLSQDQIGAWAW